MSSFSSTRRELPSRNFFSGYFKLSDYLLHRDGFFFAFPHQGAAEKSFQDTLKSPSPGVEDHSLPQTAGDMCPCQSNCSDTFFLSERRALLFAISHPAPSTVLNTLGSPTTLHYGHFRCLHWFN